MPGAKVYDVSHIQLFQGDQLRGYASPKPPQEGGTLQPGRRVLAAPLNDPEALLAMNAHPGRVAAGGEPDRSGRIGRGDVRAGECVRVLARNARVELADAAHVVLDVTGRHDRRAEARRLAAIVEIAERDRHAGAVRDPVKPVAERERDARAVARLELGRLEALELPRRLYQAGAGRRDRDVELGDVAAPARRRLPASEDLRSARRSGLIGTGMPPIEPSVPDATAFAALRPESVQFLLGRAQTVALREGQCLLREGDPGGDLYVVREGRVEVFLERPDEGSGGARIHLANLGPGDCLGETSLLGVLPRTASVVALTDGVAIRLRNTDLLALSERDPREFAILMINLGREVARRLWQMNERLLDQLRAKA